MSYYEALAAKWATLPAATTGAEVLVNLATLNALTVPGSSRPVSILEAVDYLRRQGVWQGIRIAAPSNPAAWAAVDFNDDVRATTIDFADPHVQAMLVGLVQSSLLTQEQADALTAMGTPLIRWIDSIEHPSTGDLNVHDLINAGIITEEFARAEGIY